MTLQIKLSLKMLKKKELNFNKKERKKLGNYGSVSNFDTCAKVYQNFFLEKCKSFLNSFLSEYMAAYRESYGTNQVFIRLKIGAKKASSKFPSMYGSNGLIRIA